MSSFFLHLTHMTLCAAGRFFCCHLLYLTTYLIHIYTTITLGGQLLSNRFISFPESLFFIYAIQLKRNNLQRKTFHAKLKIKLVSQIFPKTFFGNFFLMCGNIETKRVFLYYFILQISYAVTDFRPRLHEPEIGNKWEINHP